MKGVHGVNQWWSLLESDRQRGRKETGKRKEDRKGKKEKRASGLRRRLKEITKNKEGKREKKLYKGRKKGRKYEREIIRGR
jgi:hypothetical protein